MVTLEGWSLRGVPLYSVAAKSSKGPKMQVSIPHLAALFHVIWEIWKFRATVLGTSPI